MNVMKIGLLAVAGVMIALQFKSTKQEYGVYIGMAVCLIIFSYVVTGLSSVLGKMGSIQSFFSQNGTYFQILLKVIGITYICEFTSGICKDAGYHSISGQIEIFGKLSVLVAGMPILFSIIESIQEIGR